MKLMSQGEGIGGAIKSKPEDFIVEEITQNGTILEIDKSYSNDDLKLGNASEDPKLSVFIMQKRDWNTLQALKMIAKRFRKGLKSIGFAGTKDKIAMTTQLCSIFGVTPKELMNFHIKDIKINGAWGSETPIKLGELSGNRFTITIRDAQNTENVNKINDELNGILPNYFGEQRFGYRNNNVEIGIEILKGDFKAAALKLLTDTSNETNEESITARKRLAVDLDFKAALQYFPMHLKFERSVIEYLSQFPTDYRNAMKKLPRALLLMFVHSVDSYIFNLEVEQMVNEKDFRADVYGNILGYDSETTPREDKILAGLGIKKESFRVRNMPELNCKGAKRLLFVKYRDFSSEIVDQSTIKLRFSLPSGSYATVLLEEFMKNPQKG